MTKYMLIERKKEDCWQVTEMQDLKDGEVFRMVYPETGDPFIGDGGLTEWKVKGEPYTQNINGKNIWTVIIDEGN